jgi:hypothetical protein
VRVALAISLSALLLLLSAPAAPAGPGYEAPQATHLRVSSAEGDWQDEPDFRLDWDETPLEPAYPVAAVEYQLFDELGNPAGPVVRNTIVVATIERLSVPAPGIYTARVWLTNSAGTVGPATSATLRYDGAAPGTPSPQAPPGWLAADEPARLEIGHPGGPAPRSGIRGYAVSTDDGGGSAPCAVPSHCTIAETDLAGGAEDDTISLGPFPEGVTVARVVTVSGAGVASPVATASFRVDATRPSLTLAGVPSGWANGPVRVTAAATDSLSGMAAAGAAGPFTAVAVDGGAPRVVPGDTAEALVTGSGTHRVIYFARDVAGNANDGVAGAAPPETALVRIDEEPPRVLFAAAQDPAEPERIEARVEDGLSGPSRSRGEIAVRPVGGKAAFTPLPTQITGERLRAIWDSDAFPDGKYEFRATAYDAASNLAVGANRARGGRMVLVNPVKTPVSLEAGFGARRRTAPRAVPYGRGVRLGGRLRTEAGAPLAGREVAVAESFEGRSRPRRTYVRTDGNGSFSVWLRPGPSREIVASFDGTRLLTRASARTLRLGVRAGVRLRASRSSARVGGAPVVFSGSVGHRGATLPSGGISVDLQFRYPGAEWSEFRTVPTDARGRFRYPYAFSDDDSRGVRFRFRACVGAEDGWPYESGCSKSVSVRGS